jgi:hypothetical protein
MSNTRDPRYRFIHNRLRAQRGPASDHLCVDCGDAAAHWSFSNYDDVPLRTQGRPFSMNPRKGIAS